MVIATDERPEDCTLRSFLFDSFASGRRRKTAQPGARTAMPDSKRIAGLMGPTLVAMLISESPLIQPHLYDNQIPPVVYLSGALMFVAGLAVVRAHNIWARNWTVLVTLVGWFFLGLGLFRMFAAAQYRQAAARTSSTVFVVLEGVLLLVALFITYQGYRRP